jgi:3-isopropylmalate/(R)-2-methylmalate dehydratase small subunit
MTTSQAFTKNGRAWVFGDDVLNDGGIASLEMVRKFIYDPEILKTECMRALNPVFPEQARAEDVVVAGTSFGKGQLHVTGPLSLKGVGVGLVCESVTRAFFRLSVSAGLLMLPFVPGITRKVQDGDPMDVDFRTGRIENRRTGEIIHAQPMPDFVWEILDHGGEREWLAAKFGTAGAPAA